MELNLVGENEANNRSDINIRNRRQDDEDDDFGIFDYPGYLMDGLFSVYS